MILTKKILIVDGPAAAGKSTFINKLRLSTPELAFVDLDILKDRTFHLEVEEKFEKWNNVTAYLGDDWRRIIAFDVGLFWTESLMSMERPIVIELCDTFQKERELSMLTQKYKYKQARILLLPEVDTCITRNKLRFANYNDYSFIETKVKQSYVHYINSLKNTPKRYFQIIKTEQDSSHSLVYFQNYFSSLIDTQPQE